MTDLIRKENALMQARPEYLNPQQKKLASYNQGWNDAVDEYFDRIKEIPCADRLTGEWVLECDGGNECDNLYRCSMCGVEYGCEEYDRPNFCPNCGAKMDGGKE